MKLKLALRIVCLLFFLSSICSIAQVSNSMVSSDSIKIILKKSVDAFTKSTEQGIKQGVSLLTLAESLANQSNDPYIKILVNREKISFYFNNRDSVGIKRYLSKNLDIISKLGDKKYLGLYYEDLAVYKYSQGKKKEGFEATVLAEKLLSEYGEIEDAIDINYNLSLNYMRDGKHNISIKHALISLEAINETKIKQDRRKNLYLFLAENYINLKKFDSAEVYLNKVEKEHTYDNDTHFKGRFFEKKGLYYEELGDFKNATFFYKKSSALFFESHVETAKEVTAGLILSGQLSLQEAENKRIKIQNELKEQELRNINYIILLGALVIFGLVVLSIIQYRVSRYKTETNRLLKNNFKELVQANKKADKALEVKSEFLDSVTHELLTPLNTIKGTTFLLQKETLSTQQINQIKLINVSSDYLLNLINDVIQLNDLEKENLELKNEEFDLKSLLNNLIDSSLASKNNGNKIHRKIDDNIPDILKGDMLKISQIILNILDNALKFTKNGDVYVKALFISVIDTKVKIEISIRDTGIGMTEKQIHGAFEAFRQGSVRINRKYGGTGLGLSIVKKILQLYDSDVVIESKPNKGTSVTFIVDFEICTEVMDKDKVKEDYNDKQPYDDSCKEINILLVEDNKVNQLITKKIISNYGICCESANDGEEAVYMAKKNSYSMILMDIMMPKMDGFEATKYIKQYNNKIPIVALTAISEKINKKKFNDVGIHTILSKPVNPELLYKTIKKYCAVLD